MEKQQKPLKRGEHIFQRKALLVWNLHIICARSSTPHDLNFLGCLCLSKRDVKTARLKKKNLVLNWVFTLPRILHLVFACLLHFKWGRYGYQAHAFL